MKKIFYILILFLFLFSCNQEEVVDLIIPDIEFGVSKEVVLSNETNNLIKENDTILSFYSEKNDRKISYAFQNDSLIAISIVFGEGENNKRIKKILDDKYITLTPDYKSCYYCSQDKKTIIVVSDNDVFGLNILYLPYSQTNCTHTLHSLYILGIERFY